MYVSIREGVLWWPLIAAATFVLAVWLQRADMIFMFAAVFDHTLFAKIEGYRQKGLTIDVAIALAAEQERADEDALLEQHFAWCIQRYSAGENTETASEVHKIR